MRWWIRIMWWSRRWRRSICRGRRNRDQQVPHPRFARVRNDRDFVAPKIKSPALSPQRTRRQGRVLHFLGFYDLFCTCVPDRYFLAEVGGIGQVAADGGVVAKDFILGDRFSGADGLIEIGLVVNRVAVAGRRGVGFAFSVYGGHQGAGFGMIFVPLLQILITQRRRPAADGIAF